MKKLTIFAAAALSVVSLSAQQKVMRLHLADGTSQTHKVENVTKITFEEADDPENPDDPAIKMVDLGLSVKWATYNVGATSVSEAGNFYAYGEIEPKESYTLQNYKWRYPDYNEWDCDEWEKYLKLGATITGTRYDVAHIKWGDQWRMPTMEEFEELCTNCTWTKTAINGVEGMLGTSAVNGNTIFFPCAGNMIDSGLTHEGTNAFLWTATEYIQDDITAEVRNYRACIDVLSQSAQGYDYPECGFNVRAVYGPVPETVYPEVEKPTADDMVDLGLSVKWASHNLGATTPGGKGLFLCWGEMTEKQYSHSYNYKYYDPYEDSYDDIGTNICGTEYDAATFYWGDGWRMPSKAEMEELINLCTWEKTSTGYTVTGPNGNSIVLPAYGMETYKGITSRGNESVYYPTGETETGTSSGCTMLLGSRNGYGASFSDPQLRTWSARAGGVQIRPVHP